MIAAERTAIVLLAAGLSTRFGPADKLAELLDGLPIGLHAAQSLRDMPFGARIAVTGPQPIDLAPYGFTIVCNEDPAAGQAHSIALGVRTARRAAVDAILILLADMPFVKAGHIQSLLDGLEDDNSIVASGAGGRSGPPAIFGKNHFDRLERLTGDRGAKEMILQARLIAASPAELADIDTRQDIERARLP